MRIITAYFAGVGTVGVAVAMGLGGGLLISHIASPHEPKTEMSKLELRMSSKPIPVSTAPAEPVPQAATAAAAPAAAAPAAAPPQVAQTAQSVPQSEAPAVTQATANVPPENPAPQAANPEPAKEQVKEQPRISDAFAKARDSDVKRAERRRVERRAQWTERRRYRQNQDQELQSVEQRVREETEPRHAFSTEPVRLEMPHIRFFDTD